MENRSVSWAVLVLQARKPITVFAPRWAEQGAVGWAELLVVLLRFVEPPGLRAGPFGPPPERAARTRQNWGGELG